MSSSRRSRPTSGLLGTPMKKDPDDGLADDKQACVQKVVDKASKIKDVTSGQRLGATHSYEWSYFASSEGSYIEQEIYTTTPQLHRDRAQGRRDADAQLHRRAGRPAAGKSPKRREMLENAERVATEAVEICTAKPVEHGRQGPDPDAVARDAHDPRDRRARHRARSHRRLRGQLRRHQLREAVGRRQAEVRLEAVQRHRRQDHRRRRRHDRLRRRRREDAGVADRRATASWSACRPTARRRTSSARRTAAAAPSATRGATIRSCACRTSTSSRARPARRRPKR